MRIYAFEMRDDEQAAFQAEQQTHNVELILDKAVPNLDNAERAAGCIGVSVLGQGTLDRELLTRYRDLGVRFLSTRTVGFNHIDLDAATELGIKVCNAMYPPNGVADFTVMLLLMCVRNYRDAMWRSMVNDYSLTGLVGNNISDLTIGVVGTGSVGCQVMKNLSGFGCRMLACDQYENEMAKQYAAYVDLDTIFRESDVITLHTPLTPETDHFINHDSISAMKDGVIIINTARGQLADINALVDGVESGKIGALGMDTTEGEEGIIHEDHRSDMIANKNWFYLRQFKNVVMTQHMAFYTRQSVEMMVKCGVEGVVMMERTGSYRTALN